MYSLSSVGDAPFVSVVVSARDGARPAGSELNWFDSEPTKDCIRICLVIGDAIERRFPRCECKCPGKPGCLSEQCITDYHETCFQTCGSRSAWILLTAGKGGLFPEPGIFFPGGGC